MQIGPIANKIALDQICRQTWRTSRSHCTTVHAITASRRSALDGHEVLRRRPCGYSLNVWRSCSKADFTTSSRCNIRYRPAAVDQLYRPRRPKFRYEERFLEEDVRGSGQRDPEDVVWKPYVSHPHIQDSSKDGRSLRISNSEQESDETTPEISSETLHSTSSEKPSSSIKAMPHRTRRIPRIHASAEALEEELQWLARNDPHPLPIRTILSILIRKHKIKPEVRHYEALLLSNCSPAGSAKQVSEILNEMDRIGIDINSSIFAAAFDALAVHPSTDLVLDLISLLNRRWMTLTPNMQYSIVLALIRTDQLELANIFLNDLHASQKVVSRTNRTPVPIYLYVIFLQQLVARKDYDAVLRLIYKLRDRNAFDMDFPRPFWKWVLDHAARDGDSWLSRWIWQESVETMRIKPGRDTCLNVLKIAARDKEPELAESVRQTIEHGGSEDGQSVCYDQRLSKKFDATETAETEKKLNNIATLTNEEENLVKSSYEKPVDDNKSGKHPSIQPPFKSGNMWPFFDDSEIKHDDDGDEKEVIVEKTSTLTTSIQKQSAKKQVKKNARFDPWDALVPPGQY